jgi:glycosyltransferase involved in cell wall biosynthesis
VEQPGLVTIIIPTYNRAHTVVGAVESALAQDYPQLEILVVDDGSTDDTRARLAKYEGHSCVRCLFQANEGVAGARNHGIREARGEFIAILDSDDLYLPGKISLQVKCLRLLPEAGLIWSDMDAIHRDGQVVAKRYLRKMYGAYRFFPRPLDLFERELEGPEDTQLYFGDIFSAIALGNLVHTSTLMMRASRIREAGSYDSKKYPAKKPGEDHDFHLRLCKVGPVAFVDAVTIHYLTGAEDAITHKSNNRIISLSYLEMLTTTLEKEAGRIKLPFYVIHTALADAYAWVGQAHYAEGMFSLARGYLFRSLTLRPFRLTQWKFLAASLLPAWVRQALKALKHRRAS